MEQQYPARAGEEKNLAFGVLFINGGLFAGPTRTLHINAKVDDVKKYDLDQYWDIKDTDSAKETLNQLASLPSNNGFSPSSIYSASAKTFFTHFEKLSPEQQKDPAELNKWVQALEQINQNIKVEAFGKMYERLSLSYQQIMGLQNIDAWDIERLAGTARKCYFAGYITEDECYQYLAQARSLATARYANWQEYLVSFMTGRVVCYKETGFDQWIDVAQGLLETPNSIWDQNKGLWTK
ncbi:DUF1266 domain-containing protein [Limnobaculum sp. M2-1]|nr:DUF1266 domain-containing protein [Limnobaculum allomyrinae]MBV7690438.1 DUF1266 domain-containing protein [Limnobaculum sp. M2-1]